VEGSNTGKQAGYDLWRRHDCVRLGSAVILWGHNSCQKVVFTIIQKSNGLSINTGGLNCNWLNM